MRFAACCLSRSVRAGPAMEARLSTSKVRRTSEVVLVSGCRCCLGDLLLVLLFEWKEARHPFGHRPSLRTQLQDLDERKRLMLLSLFVLGMH